MYYEFLSCASLMKVREILTVFPNWFGQWTTFVNPINICNVLSLETQNQNVDSTQLSGSPAEAHERLQSHPHVLWSVNFGLLLDSTDGRARGRWRHERSVLNVYLLTLCTVLHWYSVYCTGRPVRSTGGHPPDPTSSLL